MNKDQIINLLSSRLHELITLPGADATREAVVKEISHLLRQATSDGPGRREREENQLSYNGNMTLSDMPSTTYSGSGLRIQ